MSEGSAEGPRAPNPGGSLSPEKNADPLIGRVFEGRYRLVSVLGAGGVAVVYRAQHLTLGRLVAIKVLQQDHELAAMLLPRFEREAQALAALSHPNIVTVTDYGIADGLPFLAMELLEGETLRQAIDGGRLSPWASLHITRQILRALSYAHAQGVVHRDLKPLNVLVQHLDGEEHVKILDFGFAKFFGHRARPDEPQLTHQGTAFGTPAYIAPEQISGSEADGRADIYAMGVMLFEMLTGRKPFDGAPMEVLRAHLIAPIPSIAEIRPDLPFARELESIVRCAMAKEPKNRFADAQTMLSALEPLAEKIRGGTPTPTPPGYLSQIGDLDPSSRPMTALLVALLGGGLFVILGLIGIAFLLLHKEPPQPDAPFRIPLPQLRPAVLASSRRPPPADPWKEPLVPPLDRIKTQIEISERVSQSALSPLYGYAHAHPHDPRPHLLLAYAFMKMGWRADVIKSYERAYHASASSRGDARMLRDLIILITRKSVGSQATRALKDIYGREALPSLDRAIEASASYEDAAGRLRRARKEIAESPL